MKILFYRYGSICEPDVLEAFEELGHSVTQITTEITNKELSWGDCARLVGQALSTYSYDCIFTINFFPAISEVCNIFKIIYICWIVDSPVMELFTKSVQNTCNRIFLFDKKQYLDIAPLNPDCVFHYPLAVNVKAKQAVIQNAPASIHNKYKTEISFVGSLYSEKCPYDKLSDPPDYLTGYLNGIMESQLKIYGYYFIDEVLPDDVIQEFKAHLPNYYQSPMADFLTDKITVSQLYIGNKLTALERVRTMTLLAEHFPLDIYTGSDTSDIPKIHNRGFAKTLTEMPLIFKNSKINLNTTSRAIRSGIPLRVFDIMGCEGFVLSNYQPELIDLFEPGVEFDFYTSEDELLEKAHYYLNHEKTRKEIAHNAYEKVSKEYNYLERIQHLLHVSFS